MENIYCRMEYIFMKCPVCGNDNNMEKTKQWSFGTYKVSRMTCPTCGANFNHYEGDKTDFTIPKPKNMK